MALNPSTIKDFRYNQKDVINLNTFYLENLGNQSVLFISPEQLKQTNGINFCSDEIKIIVPILNEFFHFYAENFAELLFYYKLYPEINVVIVSNVFNLTLENILTKSHLRMFFHFLHDNNISYTIIDINHLSGSAIKNYIAISNGSDTKDQGNMLFELAQKYVKENNQKNKVYIRTDRVKNEEVLEKYLMSFGFDIFYPEKFNSFFDQMNYFYNSNIVISATSAGLVNSSFMKSESTVIELITPIRHATTENETTHYEIHNIYNIISIQRNHRYIAISNIDKDASDIIKMLEKDNALINMLGNNE